MPDAAIASQWIDYTNSNDHAGDVPAGDLVRWWTVFQDPVLNELIRDAYAENLTLRQAGERIAEARAVRGIVVGELFPQTQELAGGYSFNKASEETALGTNEQWFREAEVGANVNWELDFWGRYRRSIEAADAELEATIADYDDVTVLLLADLASNYIQYRTLQERLALAMKNVQIQQEAYELAADKFQTGTATERDAQQARQVLAQTQALVPELEAALRRTNNAICVLMGLPPHDLSPRLGDAGAIPIPEPHWATGIPADLLRRRPDVRRAERLAASESAQIGVAKSDLYPRFSLTGSIGVRSEHMDDLFDTPGSLSGFIGPFFQWDILNYGRLTNAVTAQEARFRQAVLRYRDAVLRANREAEDAIISHAKARERADFLADSVAAARRTVEITYDQYRQGVIDFTPVYLFEATLTTQEDELAQAQGDVSLTLVDLYRSLGGGWDQAHDSSVYDAPMAPVPDVERPPAPLLREVPPPAPPPQE